MIEAMQKRRSIYGLGKLEASQIEQVETLLGQALSLTPDAFNMKSARAVLLLGEQHELLWEKTHELFEGKLAREKADSFKSAAGTILYFTDQKVVQSLAEQYALYAARFPEWAKQAVGMLEYNVWTLLAEQGIGANLQHYNPVIDEMVKQSWNLPAHWHLDAQMPFGQILSEAAPKETETVQERLLVLR